MTAFANFETQRSPTPSRVLKKGKYGKHITHFPSEKNRTTIVCESELEADFCIWLEYDAEVVAYAAQPGTFAFAVTGTATHYTPDFEVTYSTGEIKYFEVKPDHVLQNTLYLTKMNVFRALAEQEGYGFRLVTERDIRIQPKLHNLQNLYSRLHSVGELEIAYLLEHVRTMPAETTLRALLGGPTPPSMKATAKGLFAHWIYTDLDQPLTLDCQIRLNGRQDARNA